MAKPQTKKATGGRRSPTPRRGRAARPRRFHRRGSTLWIAALLGVAIVLLVLATRRQGGGPAATELPFTGGDFHSMVVDPGNTSRIFVGGHQAVAVTEDSGRTWRQVESLEDADAMGWAFSDRAIMVGGHPGISVSTDGGKTFRRSNGGLPSTDIHSLGAGGDVVYAASPQAGLLVSPDGGKTWEIRERRIARAFMGGILVDEADPNHLIAPDMRMGAVESRDGGRSWRAMSGGDGVMWVSWDRRDARYVVASGSGHAATSRDGGKMWERLQVPPGASIVEVAPGDPRVLYAGVHDGARVAVHSSKDGGTAWNPTASDSRGIGD